MRYSIITTCKARLSNLQKSLPQFVKQSCEVIVVDYDCPEGTEEFVRSNYPSVKIVSVQNKPMFNSSDARNIGAKNATGEELVFLDADVIVSDVFMEHLNFPSDQNIYGIFDNSRGDSLRGSCIVKKKDFVAVGGYDELLSGYEGEDLDLYMMLRNHGCRPFILASDQVLEIIEQSVDDRLRYRKPNIKLQFLRGQLYQLVKEMVLRAQNVDMLRLEYRTKMLNLVDAQLIDLYEGKKDFKLTINLPDKYKRGLLREWDFSTAVTVNAKRRRNPAGLL